MQLWNFQIPSHLHLANIARTWPNQHNNVYIFHENNIKLFWLFSWLLCILWNFHGIHGTAMNLIERSLFIVMYFLVHHTKTSHNSCWYGSFMAVLTRWRHDMETLSVLLAFCMGNPPVTIDSPYKTGIDKKHFGASCFLFCQSEFANNHPKAGDCRRHMTLI